MTGEAVVPFATGGLTLVLLVIALGIFAWLTVKSRSVKSFQFQVSLFIVVWIIGEIADLLQEREVMLLSYHQGIGLYIHVLAMGLFSAMLWSRFYLSRRSGKKVVDSLQEEEEDG